MNEKRVGAALLELWQVASRQVHLAELVPELAKILKRINPLEKLVISVLDEKLKHLSNFEDPVRLDQLANRIRGLDTIDAEQLGKWCRSDRVLRRGKRLSGVLGILLPEGATGDVMAIPLHSEITCAAMILIGPEGSEFSDEHLQTAQRVSGPINVAVGNHHRIHEMTNLREAAEADKGALLRRLGRTELGDQIIGEFTGLRKVIERVRLVATSDAPVIVLGETGSGKELIARALHNRGHRSEGPFIRVNCGAIPPELIDSQLFGHEKGAFTGAEQSRQGWFERADGGTLFLDEIGELPLEAQVRFLRVLQDGFVERVGSEKPVQVDVRVVAATHRDLATMVANGKFREDLWYRVAVFPILLPPLRERRDDIPELAAHFAERAAHRFGLIPVRPTQRDVEILQGYHWPGNIRELGSVIDRAAILGDGKSLDVSAALGLAPHSAGSTLNATEKSGSFPNSHLPNSPWSAPEMGNASPIDLSLDQAMRRHIEFVLQKTRGKIQGRDGAAEFLAINPHTLRARMRKLKIKWLDFRRSD